MAAQPTLIHSVVRALNLLDAVGAAEDPVTAKHLARTTGLPLATTYHLLRTMVHGRSWIGTVSWASGSAATPVS